MPRISRVTTLLVVPLCLLGLPIPSPGDDSTIFHKPVRLQADGKPIDTGEAWGHSGPALADVDGDGLRDLVVGDFGGKFTFYRNIGSHSEPRYAPPAYLQAGDADAEVPIYCRIGSSPHFVDFDADGKVDFISGSYAPGECYLFRGLGNGKFAARETIVDASGKPVLRKPDQKQEFESYGSWPVMIDWDNDGDLDLLVGGFDGTVFVRLNQGSRQKPVFASANLVVQADGKELKVPGDEAGHAAPAIADWDQDGRWDLLCGSERGSVYFYRNIGQAESPQFAAGQEIIPPHQGIGYEEFLELDAEPPLGIRSQIAATDYNGDGKVDLLVGDFCTTLTPRANLTAAERAQMLAVYQQIDELNAGLRRIIKDLRKEFAKRYPGDAILTNEADAEWEKAYKAMRTGKEYTEREGKTKDLHSTLSKFLVKPATKGSFVENATSHGYVWLFLRK